MFILLVFLLGCSKNSINLADEANKEQILKTGLIEDFSNFNQELELRSQVYGPGNVEEKIVAIQGNSNFSSALQIKFTPLDYLAGVFPPFLSLGFNKFKGDWSDYKYLNFYFKASAPDFSIVYQLLDCSKLGQGKWSHAVLVDGHNLTKFNLMKIPLTPEDFNFSPQEGETVENKRISFMEVCGSELLIKVNAKNVTENFEFGKFFLIR